MKYDYRSTGQGNHSIHRTWWSNSSISRWLVCSMFTFRWFQNETKNVMCSVSMFWDDCFQILVLCFEARGLSKLLETFKIIGWCFGIIFFSAEVVFSWFGSTFGGQWVTFGGQGVTFRAQMGHFLSSKVDSEQFWARVGNRITKSQTPSLQKLSFWPIWVRFGSHLGVQKWSKSSPKSIPETNSILISFFYDFYWFLVGL